MNIKTHYENTIKTEIEIMIQEVDSGIGNNDNIREYHQGWRVFFSPVIFKPKVLLIGINPGAGAAGLIDIDFWDGSEMFEYTNPEYSFALARETKAAFHEAGLDEVLATSTVKTNYFFLSTKKEKDLYEITSWLGRGAGTGKELLGDKLFRKSGEWTKSLIQLVQPEVIICEGKTAYENVAGLFPEYGEYDWANDCGYTIVPAENLIIIGYSRMISRIKNKSELAKLLKRFVKA